MVALPAPPLLENSVFEGMTVASHVGAALWVMANGIPAIVRVVLR